MHFNLSIYDFLPKNISLRWADLDPNFHLRHSVYYDLATQFLVELLEEAGLTMAIMKEQGFGPVIFREECVFKKEISFGDVISLSVNIINMREDASRWTIRQQFMRGEIFCATLNVDGAWMDVKNRLLANPTPTIALEIMKSFPKAEGFVYENIST